MRQPTILFAGAVSAGLSVALGAFGAHALKHLPPENLAWFETGARYQMYHALALLLLGIVSTRKSRLRRIAAWMFLVGTLLFSGSLYVMAITDVRVLGAVTPFGGTAFLVGWVLLATVCLASSSSE